MSKGEHQPMHGLSSLIEIKQRRLQVLREQTAPVGLKHPSRSDPGD